METLKILILVALVINVGVCFLRHLYSSKKYLNKIDILKKEIEKKKKDNKYKIKIYHNFFNIISSIYKDFNADTVGLYTYDVNKLNHITMKFLYQIRDGKAIFKGRYNDVPISNIDLVSKSFFNEKKYTYIGIDELVEYDNGLYDILSKDGVKNLYIINLFDEKNKPIGFFTLTYKEDIDENMLDELLSKCNDISNILKHIK